MSFKKKNVWSRNVKKCKKTVISSIFLRIDMSCLSFILSHLFCQLVLPLYIAAYNCECIYKEVHTHIETLISKKTIVCLPDNTVYETVSGSKRLTKSSLEQIRKPELVINLMKKKKRRIKKVFKLNCT